MRGEDVRSLFWMWRRRGSPPHARGRLHTATGNVNVRGITPACAGKTSCDFPRVTMDSDHPRMRGEDLSPSCVSFEHGGSPPHARGRHISKVKVGRFFRIPPACAGKTHSQPSLWGYWEDHPRMRGEDTGRTRPVRPPEGSPPHARGRLDDFAVEIRAIGITPACAGKTSKQLRSFCGSSDHPRMRGEDS